MPRNSPTGFICAFFATFMGFALIWHIWWLAGLAVVGAYVTFVVFAWRDQDEYVIPADEVAQASIGPTGAPAARRWRACRPRNERLSGGRGPRRSDSASNVRARSGMLRPVSKRIIVGYGFWIFLLSDIVMFSAFFATYAVLVELDRGRTERARFVSPWQRGT